MLKPFRTAAVLGAGVMGTQIAAHLANAGLTVHLLNLAAPGENKNALVEAALKKGSKQSPPLFFTEKTIRRIVPGNFDEHFDRIAEADWVIEAIVEDLAVKQKLMARVEATIGDRTVVSTNTSGLSIREIAAGRSKPFRQRFLGTHFFNPPRYLPLLELIPTPDTDPEVLERLQAFGRLHLGKGIVVAKDTPNFIANRVGMYATLLGLQTFADPAKDYTIAEIDILTGTLVGRPKSATFRTADLVGLDTLTYVADNLYPVIPDDEGREVFRLPELLRKLVAGGALGAKAGQGFYKKVEGQILALNPETFGYELPAPPELGDVRSLSKMPNLGDRLRALYRDPGRAGAFFRESILKTLSYAACRIPEVADRPLEIDRALQWGFGWELGPFAIWDELGFEPVLQDMQAATIAVPAWIEDMRQSGATCFYQKGAVYTPARQYVAVEMPTDEIDLAALKADPARVLWENPEAALLDLGDGVVLYEFRSKGNTLSFQVLDGLAAVLDLLAERNWRGLVIGNGGQNFSAGANLAEMGGLAQAGQLDKIATVINRFQTLTQRIYYFPKPIVAAVRGLALGGGCEVVMACPHVVAAAESYIGLVELGVGLIPGGSGLMRSLAVVAQRARSEDPQHLQPWLRQAFETIAMAKVANSAAEAQEFGYLPPNARIVMNGDRRLAVAKAEVLHLDRLGYLPPPKLASIPVLGSPARSALDHAAYVMHQGGYASEYDRFLAGRLAYVMTGGSLSAPAAVSEEYLLGLEREVFLPLLAQPKTQERIAHTLKTKKPLRN
ncbi:MAG: 3-hydroxyacyl-CoA dehydrogenase/enoyl-CoA hydratase family protein [Cyanobacteria bacterium J06641_5]